MQLAILAADFTPGEADALRRAMAAWKRKGGLGPFHTRLVGRMVDKGYTLEYAERIFKQIEGFGEYGFPESHAASFALLVYVSAWIKRHHPDAFLAALLNSQPMGFYAPAQLTRDARAHGVQVLPVDALKSEWTSVLEETGTAALWPVRLGFNRLLGFAARGRRAPGGRAGVGSVRRHRGSDAPRLPRRACAAIAVARRCAAAAGSVTVTRLHGAPPASTPVPRRCWRARARTKRRPCCEAPTAGEELLADYRSTGLSLTNHPLALLRERLAAYRVQPAVVLNGYRSGQLARASGLVTHRQRPETAKGVIFVTLEDETGAVNVIVWPQVAEAQRKPLLASTLLTVYGVWQCEGEVRHLIARKLVDHSVLLQGLSTKSRNFH